VRSQIQKPSRFLSKHQRNKILKKTISLLVPCECETWSLDLKTFENELGLVVHMRQGKSGGGGRGEEKLYNEKCHTLYSSKKY